MDLALLDSRLLVALVSTCLGALLMVLIRRVVNKRGLFTYFVRHNKIGMSADDKIFGSVQVKWNDSPIRNPYLSTVELKNESLKDYKDVEVKIFTNNTTLLSERTELVGTTRILTWTREFLNKFNVASGGNLTNEQVALHGSQREYLIPVMNRGQVVRIAYLNTAHAEFQPLILMDIVHKGVKLKLRVPRNEVMGVPQLHAALVGSALGFFVIASVIILVDAVWLAATICMLYGLFVIVPGAVCIKSWHWLRKLVGD